MVESKRIVSVGECICGHPLDSPDIFENHQPHNSFDENGVLKSEAWTADDQLRGEAAITKAKERKLKQEEAKQQEVKSLQSKPISSSLSTFKVDSSIFKVPSVSPLASSKQQQQTSPQQMQNTASTKFSIFGALPLPSIDNVNNNISTLKPKTSSFIDTTSVSPSPVSIATNNIFKTELTKSANDGSLFKNASPSSNVFNSNIFGNVPKPAEPSTASNNIFLKPTQPNILETPRNNDVFEYFETKYPDFSTLPNKTPEPIFHSPSEEFAKKKALMVAQEEETKNRAAAAEEARKQSELERERIKKLEEDERQRKAEEATKAARLAAERSRRIQQLRHYAELEAENLLTRTQDEEIEYIAKKELDMFRLLDAKAQKFVEQLLEELVHEEVKEIALEEHNTICHDRTLLERYLSIWLKATRKKIEQRRVLETTPLWVTTDTSEKQTQQLQHPSQTENLSMIKRYRLGEPCNLSVLCDENDDFRWRHSINICKMVSNYIASKTPFKKIQQRQYLKLLFTLPGKTDEIPGFETLCTKLLKDVLQLPSDDVVSNSKSFICTVQENVALCVRKVSGVPPINESGQSANENECDNVDGIICFMTCSYLTRTRQRLHYIVQNSKNFKRLPVAFVVYGSEYSTEKLADLLELENLLDHGKIHRYKFYNWIGGKTDYNFKTNLENALSYTIRSSIHYNADISNLEMQSTQNWLETCLGEEMWRRWRASELQNPAFCKICSLIPHVIGLYNAAVGRLRKMLIKSPEKFPEFPVELRQLVPKLDEGNSTALGLEYFSTDWKSCIRTQTILDFLESILLPVPEEDPPVDVNNIKMWLLDYAALCITNNESSASATYFAISALVEQLICPDLQVLEIQQRMNLISYLPVLKPIVFGLINDRLHCLYANSLPNEVIYQRQHFLNYLEQPWWLNYQAVEAVTVDYTSQGANSLFEEEYQDEPQEHVENLLKKANEVANFFEQNMSAKKQKYSSLDSSLMRQLDQTMAEFEVAEASIVNPFNISTSKTSNSESKKEHFSSIKSPKSVKRKRVGDESATVADDVIAKALALIRKVDEVRDLEARLDYTTSRLNL